MYRKIEDFTFEWTNAAKGTTNVFKALTDDTLNQAIVEGHNTLGWLAWHLTGAPLFFGNMLAQLNLETSIDPQQPHPTSASEIVEAYKAVSAEVLTKVSALSDEDLLTEVPGLQQPMPRGAVLRMMIDHQTHHRGQMTVLLRQAGLEVPGVMGPTKEQA